MLICPEASSAQSPEQHRHGLSAGQHGLGLDTAAELFVQTFDGVGGPGRFPLRWIQAGEGEQLGGREERRNAWANDQGPDIDLRMMSGKVSKKRSSIFVEKWYLKSTMTFFCSTNPALGAILLLNVKSGSDIRATQQNTVGSVLRT